MLFKPAEQVSMTCQYILPHMMLEVVCTIIYVANVMRFY